MKLATQNNPSVMTHQFSRVPSVSIQRSKFDRSHGLKTTFDASRLIPILVDEVLPGDSINCKMQGFARLATPIFPIMDNLYMETFFFFVPNRLLWTNWQKFCGEQLDPGDSIDFTVPTSTVTATENEIYDYMGLPINVSVDAVNLPFRAYWLIFDSWFRDQNLQNAADIQTGDSGGIINNGTDYDPGVPARRGKRHDYFTSCLPWPQKGDSIDLPLGTVAPVVSTGVAPVFEDDTGTYASELNVAATSTDVQAFTGQSGGDDLYWRTTGLEADLTNATAATINQLRQSFQIQKILEKDARGGTRYIEIIKSHFGVTSPDARLQRPEFLGGGSTPVNITPIAQTSETLVDSPQANLSAVGTANFRGHGLSLLLSMDILSD